MNFMLLSSLCFFSVLFIVCSGYDEELKREGKLRKACSTRGNARQPVNRVNTTSRLITLREKMNSEVVLGTSVIQAYLVTSSDEHQSSDVDEYERRREYISGFSGSYGDAIITKKKAVLWTDGRYHLQADEQLNCDWLLMREGHKHIPTRSQWLRKEFPKGGRIGLNPKLVSEYMWNKLRSELPIQLELVALNVSLIDLIWPVKERGEKRSKNSFIVETKYAGKNYSIKVKETRKEIAKAGATAMVVTSLDEIAWLLNVRGRDIPFSPFLRSYVFLDKGNIILYVNSSQLVTNNVFKHLNSELNFTKDNNDPVIIKDYTEIWKDLQTFSQKHKILVPARCVYSEGASHAIYEHIFQEKRIPKQSPIIFLKAVKNSVEIQRMQEAHMRDAAAVCDCFSYIEKKIHAGNVFTENDFVTALDQCRFEQRLSLGNSFRTIVGFGSNGAQPNYEPTNNTNARIFDNSTVVVDSGGQYLGGTTDLTRTLHFGTPTEQQKEAYTRVLMGLMQLSTLTFPSNTKMASVDVMARAPLWEVGLDYLHSTGHGIGSFLSAHESPILIKYDSETSAQNIFKPGYFLSTEPGYYSEGDFGVRLENVMQVIEKQWLHTSGHTFLGFKIITLVPYEPKLIKLSLLSTQQRRLLNTYNEQVRSKVGAVLKQQNKMDGFYWMMEKTKYIPEYGHSNMLSSRPVLLFITNIIVFITIF